MAKRQKKIEMIFNKLMDKEIMAQPYNECYAMLCYAKSLQSCPTVRPHRWQPTRLCHPWDSPGKNTGVGCHFLLWCMKEKSESEVTQSCPTLSDPMDCSLPGSSLHGIFQARVLEWGAIAFSTYNEYYSEIKMETINKSTRLR